MEHRGWQVEIYDHKRQRRSFCVTTEGAHLELGHDSYKHHIWDTDIGAWHVRVHLAVHHVISQHWLHSLPDSLWLIAQCLYIGLFKCHTWYIDAQAQAEGSEWVSLAMTVLIASSVLASEI